MITAQQTLYTKMFVPRQTPSETVILREFLLVLKRGATRVNQGVSPVMRSGRNVIHERPLRGTAEHYRPLCVVSQHWLHTRNRLVLSRPVLRRRINFLRSTRRRRRLSLFEFLTARLEHYDTKN